MTVITHARSHVTSKLRQQKDEGWLNIMVARHDDGDDSIGDRRSSSLASTWSDENRLDMERWTVAGVERCQGNED